jgi:hypothetical protein
MKVTLFLLLMLEEFKSSRTLNIDNINSSFCGSHRELPEERRQTTQNREDKENHTFPFIADAQSQSQSQSQAQGYLGSNPAPTQSTHTNTNNYKKNKKIHKNQNNANLNMTPSSNMNTHADDSNENNGMQIPVKQPNTDIVPSFTIHSQQNTHQLHRKQINILSDALANLNPFTHDSLHSRLKNKYLPNHSTYTNVNFLLFLIIVLCFSSMILPALKQFLTPKFFKHKIELSKILFIILLTSKIKSHFLYCLKSPPLYAQ